MKARNQKELRCRRCGSTFLPGGRLKVKIDMAKAKRRFIVRGHYNKSPGNRPPEKRIRFLVEWAVGLSTGSHWFHNVYCDDCASLRAQRWAEHTHKTHPRRERRAPALGRRR